MKLHSQEVRKLAPENDPLKIGMGSCRFRALHDLPGPPDCCKPDST